MLRLADLIEEMAANTPSATAESTDLTKVQQEKLAASLTSLVLVYGDVEHRAPRQDDSEELRYHLDVDNIHLMVQSRKYDHRGHNYRQPILTITQKPLRIQFGNEYSGGNLTALDVISPDHKTISVLDTDGPWLDVYHQLMHDLLDWASDYSHDDMECWNPYQASLRKAAHVFNGEKYTLENGTHVDHNRALSALANYMKRDNCSPLEIASCNLTVTEGTYNYLPTLKLENDKIRLEYAFYKENNYYNSYRYHSYDPTGWVIQSLVVKDGSTEYDLTKQSGDWNTYAMQLFHNISTFVSEQPTDEEYAKTKRENELELATSLFPVEVQEAYTEKKRREQEERERLEKEAAEREAARLAEIERIEKERIAELKRIEKERLEKEERMRVEAALRREEARKEAERKLAEEQAAIQAERAAQSEQEIINSRDFLIQQLGVDKVPAPSQPDAHKKRGRLSRLMGKS